MARLDPILSAFDALDRASHETALRDIFAAAIRPYGYEAFMVVSSRLQSAAFDKMFILDQWPKLWRAQYHRENLFGVDPVARHAPKSFDAFAWHDAPIRDAAARRVLDISASDHGLRCGFCVPVHSSAGYQATVSLAGYNTDHSAHGKRAMEMLGHYLYRTVLKHRAAAFKPVLSPREREVIRWAAVGKSAWDTGEILQISEQTVKSHIASALFKLGVASKTQAVVESIRRGEINL